MVLTSTLFLIHHMGLQLFTRYDRMDKLLNKILVAAIVSYLIGELSKTFASVLICNDEKFNFKDFCGPVEFLLHIPLSGNGTLKEKLGKALIYEVLLLLSFDESGGIPFKSKFDARNCTWKVFG
ncbi:uncharacterized protein LOC113323875 [Papaver somniferum]|uniref:uncharacterized protein LOC113323875 n=1 Tax=Papaver somniferum TaxID=3469 RepID=UPI000E6FD358|nr:uncharacterized protein LOC113323875 [Papaver somniferum]